MAAPALLALSALLFTTQEPSYSQKADQIFTAYGQITQYSPIMRESLATFLEVEGLYAAKNYKKAKTVLDRFWAQYPPATTQWRDAYSQTTTISRQTGINIGTPTCYYALRMYDECLRWRISTSTTQNPLTSATLSIVIVGNSQGIQPSTKEELAAGTGKIAIHKLDPRLANNTDKLIHESTDLFTEYMQAASGGKLAVNTNIVRLNNLSIPVSVKDKHAGISGNAMQLIWDNLPQETLAKTDWWWVIYPSNVPDQYPDFKTAEFITGGMGTAPNSDAPCFISDDRWTTRKPPHLGVGEYTTVERRAYLPQWLQHEMAHHWFRTWPEFKLEEKSHQWFDRSTWPKDFVGYIEPDYYASALTNLIQTKANPPFHIALLYAPPSPKVFQNIKAKNIIGKYEHQPKSNEWHSGEIKLQDGYFYWNNDAGVSWKLTFDLANGKLKTGPDCTYTPKGSSEGPAFNLTLFRDANGNYIPRLKGFTFNGSLYTKLE